MPVRSEPEEDEIEIDRDGGVPGDGRFGCSIALCMSVAKSGMPSAWGTGAGRSARSRSQAARSL